MVQIQSAAVHLGDLKHDVIFFTFVKLETSHIKKIKDNYVKLYHNLPIQSHYHMFVTLLKVFDISAKITFDFVFFLFCNQNEDTIFSLKLLILCKQSSKFCSTVISVFNNQSLLHYCYFLNSFILSFSSKRKNKENFHSKFVLNHLLQYK